ncbi:zinc transporter ZIP3-like [Clytia hemisphaerica]|uniref:zinc transporter ZIP3-like n=1 Tax=Clytia hemisphaerica TaxID=252671 RepID=UPI0034D6F71C
METTLVLKIFGAIILFFVTFLFTLLPYKLKQMRADKLKIISCFCGGLFLGLSFLHLIPDTLRGFFGSEILLKLQSKYPFGELVIILGMILVLSAEKFASLIQINHQEKKTKCDGSESCCQEECAVQGVPNEKTPLFKQLRKPYVEDQTVEAVPSNEKAQEAGTTGEADKMDSDDDSSISIEDKKTVLFTQSNQYRKLSTTSNTSMGNKIQLLKIRTICLVIALMIHSLFEGLTVGLQPNATGVCVLVALLLFHKSLVGFSLGIALVNDKSDLRSFQKKAALFSIASPIGAIIGIIIFSVKSSFVSDEVVVVLTGLSTGTFIYVTFFEILGKCLEGDKMEDMIGFVYFVLGFGLFAGITAVPQMQV